MAKSQGENSSKRSGVKKGAPKREVQVVSCPSPFPISDPTKRKRPREIPTSREDYKKNKAQSSSRKKGKSSGLLDWHDTAKEIRNYGATAFVGKQKRNYEDEQHFKLTGRHKTKQRVPLPIVRGIKKAAAKREARVREEARAAGIVMPTEKKARKKFSSTINTYGPAPSVGFMKNGVLRVNKKT
jgi:hypothetical protein